MTITSSLRFLYIFGGSGLLCGLGKTALGLSSQGPFPYLSRQFPHVLCTTQYVQINLLLNLTIQPRICKFGSPARNLIFLWLILLKNSFIIIQYLNVFIECSRLCLTGYLHWIISKSLTLAKTEIIYPKNVRAKVAMDFT